MVRLPPTLKKEKEKMSNQANNPLSILTDWIKSDIQKKH